MDKKSGERIESQPGLFVRVIFVVLMVAAVTIFLEHIGWLRGFERSALDTWLRVRLHLSSPVESNHIVIVGITDKDYKEIFSGKSPLDKGGLEQIIKALISARPAALGVDISTSDKQFKDMQLAGDVPIIWSEDAPTGEAGESNAETLGALGGNKPASQLSGVAQLPMDNDGIIRSYLRDIKGHDSFQWAITKTFCKRMKENPAIKAQLGDASEKLAQRCEEIERINNNEEKKEILAIDFLGDRYKFQHYTAREVTDAYMAGRQDFFDKLSGRIVLLGGLFSSARDVYSTPVGRMAGVELMAHAIESELQGGGFRRPKEIYMIALSIVGGICILLLFIRFGLTRGCLFSAAIIVIIAPLWSYVAFRSFAYTTYFLPILLAVLVHQLYEHAHYYQHQWLHKLPQSVTEASKGVTPSDDNDKTEEHQPET